MYGETGELMRTQLAALLRQYRIAQRLGGPSRWAPDGLASPTEREELGQQIQQYRQTVITWCSRTLQTVQTITFSNVPSRRADPFRPDTEDGATAELVRALEHTRRHSSAPLATIGLLTTPSDNPVVELWRQAARAAALAEHDTSGELAHRLTTPQAQALAGDVAAIAQALVVLDQRYRSIPGWEHLADPGRLGWTALATGLDMSLDQPDYTVDQAGWRPRIKPIRGAPKPGILGVLQAEHNLLVRLKSIPTAMNLRLIVDSQRLLSSHLHPYAERVDPRLASQWQARATTYALVQQQLRNLGGRLGKGNIAAAEAANVLGRLKSVAPGTVIEPRVLDGFQTVFNRVDTRIADIIEEGVTHATLLQRVTLPRVVDTTQQLVHPLRERFIPVAHAADAAVVRTVRDQLRPSAGEVQRATPGRSRADLHAALVYRPTQGVAEREGPRL
ncbi:hypothetical protein GCM10023350_52460 [Nocardioides endophyticus]|uniref:Uncharacterized protein n=2 Tax=Nocardioides endophyticus TaxID=1353775 RepID=A0ABP8ZLC0_9ACTN